MIPSPWSTLLRGSTAVQGRRSMFLTCAKSVDRGQDPEPHCCYRQLREIPHAFRENIHADGALRYAARKSCVESAYERTCTKIAQRQE